MKFILTILLALNARAGGEAGNGGDVVYCRASIENSFVGYYALDYLLTVGGPFENETIEVINGWEYGNWFRKIFNPNQNGINMSQFKDVYDDYYFDTYNFQNYLREHIWIESYFELFDI